MQGRRQTSFINMSTNFKLLDYFLKIIKHKSSLKDTRKSLVELD